MLSNYVAKPMSSMVYKRGEDLVKMVTRFTPSSQISWCWDSLILQFHELPYEAWGSTMVFKGKCLPNSILLKGKRLALEGQVSRQALTCKYFHPREKVTFLLKGSEAVTLQTATLWISTMFNIPAIAVNGWRELVSAKCSLLDEICREIEALDITVFSNIIITVL